jgi:hypothetical protein
MTDERTPRVASERVINSEEARGTETSGTSCSVPRRPGVAKAIIRVPEVVTRGRYDPAGTSPIASITRPSMSILSWNLEKSWPKAV